MINFRNMLSYRRLTLPALLLLGILTAPVFANAANLNLAPTTGVYTVGQTFTSQVRVNTAGAAINAAEGTIRFDPQKLAVTSVAKGSIFNLWTADPAFSNSAGTITFSGGATPPGYTGSGGTVLSITFRVLSAGETNVRFSDGSVLAADGRGTNVLSSMGSAAYTLAAADVPAEPEVIEYVAPANTPAAPQIQSSTHPDPNGWYQKTTAELTWNLPSEVTAVRTLLSEQSGSIPTKVYETPISSITLDDLDEGVQYFHLQFQNADGWGRVAHYRLAVDTEAPENFTIEHVEDADLSAPAQILKLLAVDPTSGIARYQVQIDGGEPYEYVDETGSSTITLPPLEPGYHSVIIEAFDYAGNSRVSTYSFTILAFDKPVFTEYPSQINTEVIPVIKGQTKPNAEVTIEVQKAGSEPTSYSVVSDSSGVFTFIPEGRWQTGVYRLTAVAVDEYGAKSSRSEAIKIAVQDPGYIQIGSLIVSTLSVIVPTLALLLLLVLLLVYFVRKLRTIRSVVVSETNEALAVLDREFLDLEKTLSEQRETLETSRKTKKLTKAETELIETVQKAMDASRERVKKEIAEVDDIVE